MKTELMNGVFALGIDRPERMNALTAQVMNDLSNAVSAGSLNPDVRVIALTGDDRAFCTGADLETAAALQGDEAAATIDAANRLVESITQSPKPVVALVRGAVAGVGVPVALAADLVLCDESSYFLLAFTRVGLMPDGGTSAIVAAAIGRARAMRMALLAERLSAADAYAAGLVSHVSSAEDFDKAASDVLGVLANGPQVAFRRTKEAINKATLHRLSDAFAIERAGQIGLLRSPDFNEGARAFTEKRLPVFSDR